jgi:NAD-dependent SIR2 family protein deacetylase
MNWLKKFNENRKRRERERDLINRRETAMTSILAGVSTEDAISVFEEVSGLFHRVMQKRLERIEEERSNIEKFLNCENK